MSLAPRRTTLLASAAAGAVLLAGTAPASADPFAFAPGAIVLSTVGRAGPGDTSTYTLDQATALVLQQYLVNGASSAVAAGSLVLPQSANGANAAVSGEFGSASEGLLQRSGDGHSLAIMGYGIAASAFNANPTAYTGSTSTALGQTLNPTTPTATSVARVVASIDANALVDTSTALTGVFNGNNPRSAATIDGSSFYVSGQASTKTDPTQGVFLATRGATTASAIDTSTDTRDVQIANGKLTVSRDFNPSGSGGQRSDIDTLTQLGGLPTSMAAVTTKVLTPTGNNGKVPPVPAIVPTAGNANGIDNPRIGSFVYASPEQFFFASQSVLYVADSGSPKNGSAEAAQLGDGGLQKWVNSAADGSGAWSLDYTLFAGLGLVNNDPARTTGGASNGYGGKDNDVTGLFALAGTVSGDTVSLYATSYTKNELDTSYLFGITDSLGATSLPGAENFTTLVTSGYDQSIRGVALAPVPEPGSLAILAGGIAALGCVRRRLKAR